MKNNLLIPFLLSVLFAQAGYSQKVPSLRLHPVNEGWSNSMADLLERSGFHLPALAGTPLLQKNGPDERSELRLDSTKTFFGYQQGTGDSTPVSRTRYSYMLPGVKIESNDQYENGEWLQLNRTTFVSDDQGRMTEAFAEAFDPVTQSFQPDSKLEIFPHGDSPELIDSLVTYLWDSTILDWHILLAIRSTYDAEDRLLEKTTSIDYFGDPLIFRELYAYDTNGDNHLIEEFAILGEDVFPSSRTELKYVDHQPYEVTVYGSDGFSFFPQYRSNYAYTFSGVLRRNMNFEWDVAEDNWFLNQTIDYFYDPAGRLAGKETADLFKNAPEKREFISLSYMDEDGEDLYLEWVLYWDDELFDWVLDSKKFFYYNGLTSVDPDPVMVQNLEISPNPTVDLVRLNLETPALLQVYDMKGNLVSSSDYRPGSSLRMEELPSGVYVVTARTGSEVLTGRVIKE